ncbi:hypothetical protein SHOU24_27 [Vibrio phage SHOU24]|uniref:hypothetical protein n=1 Tax=Vibrio phage SHOU24 TaxID=1414739 RepID=UPI0003ED23C0|nr:hypothetical protein SHOU24_27 [Vibrio phage SHOU24]AHI61224.1 hypothetical protein SHOU24_27 [Vibrio phage SHOU24]
MFKSRFISHEIITRFNELNNEREAILSSLREQFGLVGFVFNPDGTPKYLLKELMSDFDEDRFSPGRINRSGNDFLGLEPTDAEIVAVCKSAVSISLSEVVLDCLEFKPQTHLHGEPSPEIKLVEGIIMVKVIEYNDLPYDPPVSFVEISESLYNAPILKLLEKHLTE